MEGTGIGDSLKGWANMDAAQRKEATMKAAAGFATGGVIGNTLDSMKSARSTSLTSQEVVRKAMQSQSRFESRIASDPEKYQPRRGSGRDESLNTSAWTDSVREAQRSAGQGAEQYMRAQRTAYGVGGVEMKEDRLTLDETALKAGTRWDNNGPEARDDRIHDKDDNGIQQTFSPEDAVSWNMAFPDQPVTPGDTITPEQAAQWNETLADPINSLEGPSDVVGDFIGANYSAGSLEDEAHRDFNEAMVNTAREAPLAAEQALMNHYNTLEGNDRLGDALLKSAIGEEAITGQTGGTFSNVRAEAREDGRRIITADYTDSNGKRSGYEIYNNNALVGKEKLLSTSTQIRESLMGKMQTVETKGSGEQISIRRVEATTHNFSSNPPENPSGDPDGPIIIDIPGQGMSSAGGPIPLFSDEEPAGGVPLKEPEFAPTPAPRAESKRGDSAPASLNEAMPMQSNIPIQEVSDHDQLPNTVLPKEGQPGFLPDLHAEHPGVGGQHAVDYVSGDDAGEGLRTNFETSGMNPFVEGRPVSAEHEERGTAYESALPVGGSRDNGLGYTDINGEKRNGENLEPETNQLRNAAFTAPQESVQMGQTKAYTLDNSGDNLNFGEKLQPVQSEPTPGSENSSTHSENPIRHENSDAARESLPGKMKVTLKETEVIHEKESPSEGPQTTESSARSDTRRETEQVGKAASNHSMPELRTESGQRISIRKQMVVTETVDLQKNTQENKPQEFHVPIPKSQRTNGIGTPQGIPGKRHRKK